MVDDKQVNYPRHPEEEEIPVDCGFTSWAGKEQAGIAWVWDYDNQIATIY